MKITEWKYGYKRQPSRVEYHAAAMKNADSQMPRDEYFDWIRKHRKDELKTLIWEMYCDIAQYQKLIHDMQEHINKTNPVL